MQNSRFEPRCFNAFVGLSAFDCRFVQFSRWSFPPEPAASGAGTSGEKAHLKYSNKNSHLPSRWYPNYTAPYVGTPQEGPL